MRRTSTTSGLLLLLVGVVLLSVFVNGALPKLLDTLFAAGPPGSTPQSAVPSTYKPGPSVGAGTVGQSA